MTEIAWNTALEPDRESRNETHSADSIPVWCFAEKDVFQMKMYMLNR